MREIGASEAKRQLEVVLDWVEQGEEVVITRRGRAVARIVPNAPPPDPVRAAEAAERIRTRAKSLGRAFDWQEWKGYRDEGRE